MRITNNMMTSRMLLNSNRSLNRLDTLYTQLATTKQFQVPSEAPILASRAIRFRSNLSLIEQYKRNADQATAWADLSDSAMTDMNNLMIRLKEIFTRGANDLNTPEERSAFVVEVRQLIAGMGSIMNSNFSGRYLFSGFKTNEPATFLRNDNLASFNINQSFKVSDIETTHSYQNLDPEGLIQFENIQILKLPYTGIENLSISFTGDTPGDVRPITTRSVLDEDAYNPGDDEIIFIPETGEIVLGRNVASEARELPRGAEINVNYDKNGFSAGDLNPKVYFDCEDLNTGLVYTMDGNDLRFEVGLGVRLPINVLAKDVFPSKIYADLVALSNFVDSVNFSDDPEENEFKMAQKALQDRFNNMIGFIDDYNIDFTRVEADLGTRHARLLSLANRLDDELIIYQELTSRNEDVNIEEVTVRLSEASTIYNYALKASSSIIQLSLINYL